jgi:hypothetical protein
MPLALIVVSSAIPALESQVCSPVLGEQRMLCNPTPAPSLTPQTQGEAPSGRDIQRHFREVIIGSRIKSQWLFMPLIACEGNEC